MSTSPARNRVTPFGEIVAVPGRGAWMGNRGVLHEGREIVRSSRSRAWITCSLSFRDRFRPQWQPGRYTQLFFLDEAVALAAGHRPCAECRRSDYNAYRAAWARAAAGAGGAKVAPYAKEMDEQLSLERGRPGPDERELHEEPWADLPDGAFVDIDEGPAVVVGDHLVVWEPGNVYGRRLDRPRSGVAVLVTPAASIAVLRAGYPVQIDDSARPVGLSAGSVKVEP